ncbi:MAG: hypothetical protein WC823_00840 [Parcubacteria group bacterium]|jgi:hypothetical protein
MKQLMHNAKLQKLFIYIGWKALGAFVFVAVAGASMWAMAAFTEPTSGPAASVQDFAKNILGANNADNGFDSSAVVANEDGSLVERLESLEKRSAGVTALSAELDANDTVVQGVVYCNGLSATAQYAIDGSNTTTTYTDWRLPTADELGVFMGITDNYNTWTATPLYDSGGSGLYIVKNLQTGSWSFQSNTYNNSAVVRVRCVR